MHSTDATPTPSPVQTARFADGPDCVLINPDLTPRDWRAARLRAALHPATVLCGLAGVALAAVAILAGAGTGFVGASACAAGILMAVTAVLVGRRRACRPLIHVAATAEGRAAGMFLRSRALTSDKAQQRTVRSLMQAVAEVHASPARPWLDPAMPVQLHRVAWHVLTFLHRTAPARALLDELASLHEQEPAEIAAARRAVTAADAALDDVSCHAHACASLLRAWEAKLRHADLATRAAATTDTLPRTEELALACSAAAELPPAVFASITAARDLTSAGAFVWEHPPHTWPSSSTRGGLS